MRRTYCWRQLDLPGLELMQFDKGDGGVSADATLIDGGPNPFLLTLHWRLDPAWRSRTLRLERICNAGETRLEIARAAQGWRIDGAARPDLAACLEIDVSATPFCNGLAIRALGEAPGELTALYVDAADLSVQPSRQRYERIGPRRWRYIDLGVAAGFEAVLELDDDLVVRDYEGLFARL
jgi:uncharacterized protein